MYARAWLVGGLQSGILCDRTRGKLGSSLPMNTVGVYHYRDALWTHGSRSGGGGGGGGGDGGGGGGGWSGQRKLICEVVVCTGAWCKSARRVSPTLAEFRAFF